MRFFVVIGCLFASSNLFAESYNCMSPVDAKVAMDFVFTYDGETASVNANVGDMERGVSYPAHSVKFKTVVGGAREYPGLQVLRKGVSKKLEKVRQFFGDGFSHDKQLMVIRLDDQKVEQGLPFEGFLSDCYQVELETICNGDTRLVCESF